MIGANCSIVWCNSKNEYYQQARNQRRFGQVCIVSLRSVLNCLAEVDGRQAVVKLVDILEVPSN